jgi:F-type H+-transporting ATPase subunit b
LILNKHRLYDTMSRLRFTYPALLVAILVLVLSPLAALAQEGAGDSQPASPAAAEVSSTSEVAHTSGSEHSDAGHGDDSHGAHSDNDPTHANVSDPTFQVIDWRTDMAFFSAIVFGLLLLVLGTTAWKPIMQGLEKRERGIAENISQAQRAANEATAKLAEYEAKLAGAAEESQRIMAEARKDAEAAGQKLIAAAQEEAARGRDRAVADIEAAKRTALGDLANQSTVLAMSLAQRVVGREVRAEDHQGLIQDMLSKLPSQN